jgi:hypothetical protein
VSDPMEFCAATDLDTFQSPKVFHILFYAGCKFLKG